MIQEKKNTLNFNEGWGKHIRIHAYFSNSCESERVFLWLLQTPWPKQLGEARFYLTSRSPSQSFMERSQGRTVEAGADAENMESAACWLALQGMLRLLSYTTQDTCPGMAHINHQPWKCPKRLSHRPFWWRNFSQPMFPFPRWPSGCQVDQKLTSTCVTWQPSLL